MNINVKLRQYLGEINDLKQKKPFDAVADLSESADLNRLRKLIKADSVNQTSWRADTDPYYGKHKYSLIEFKFSRGMNRKQFEEMKSALYKEAKKRFPNVGDISIGGGYGTTAYVQITLIKKKQYKL